MDIKRKKKLPSVLNSLPKSHSETSASARGHVPIGSLQLRPRQPYLALSEVIEFFLTRYVLKIFYP